MKIRVPPNLDPISFNDSILQGVMQSLSFLGVQAMKILIGKPILRVCRWKYLEVLEYFQKLNMLFLKMIFPDSNP